MNKSELVTVVARNADLTKIQTERVIDALLEAIEHTVTEGGKVTLVGFGSFEARQRKGRNGRNPATGETLEIPARTVPAFSPGKTFKERVDNHAKV